MEEIKFTRGDVFWFEKTFVVEEPGKYENDKMQLKAKSVVTPAIVVSNDEINEFSAKIDVVWLTRSDKLRPSKSNIEINSLKEPNVATCGFVHTIEKDRATFWIGHLTDKEMEQVDRTLARSLGLITLEFDEPLTQHKDDEPQETTPAEPTATDARDTNAPGKPADPPADKDATTEDLMMEIRFLLRENAQLKETNAKIEKDKEFYRKIIEKTL